MARSASAIADAPQSCGQYTKLATRLQRTSPIRENAPPCRLTPAITGADTCAPAARAFLPSVLMKLLGILAATLTGYAS